MEANKSWIILFEPQPHLWEDAYLLERWGVHVGWELKAESLSV